LVVRGCVGRLSEPFLGERDARRSIGSDLKEREEVEEEE